MAPLTNPPEEKLLIELEDRSPSKFNGHDDSTPPIKSGLCMVYLAGMPCEDGTTCKKNHLTLDQLLEAKLSFNETNVDKDRMTAKQADAALVEKEVTIQEVVAPSMTESDNESARPPVKAGLCMQFFKGKICKYDEACKNHHLRIDQLMEGKPSVNLEKKNEDDPKDFKTVLPRTVLATHQIERKLEAELFKSKLCMPYQEGKCDRGSKCSYIHITGPDAKRIVGIANGRKTCAFETFLGHCPQRICFFKHEKRESTPAWGFGPKDAYKKRERSN